MSNHPHGDCPECRSLRAREEAREEAYTKIFDENHALGDEIAALRTAGAAALVEMNDMLGYVPSYFQKKYGYPEAIERFSAALAAPPEPARPIKTIEGLAFPGWDEDQTHRGSD